MDGLMNGEECRGEQEGNATVIVRWGNGDGHIKYQRKHLQMHCWFLLLQQRFFSVFRGQFVLLVFALFFLHFFHSLLCCLFFSLYFNALIYSVHQLQTTLEALNFFWTSIAGWVSRSSECFWLIGAWKPLLSSDRKGIPRVGIKINKFV